MKHKPEISFDRKKYLFMRDGKHITDDQAIDHWQAVNADWTAGAYDEMSRRSMMWDRFTKQEGQPA